MPRGRLSVSVFNTWLIVMAITFGIGSWVRGCNISTRNEEIAKATESAKAVQSDIRLLRILEGLDEGRNDERIAVYTLRELGKNPALRRLGLKGLLEKANALASLPDDVRPFVLTQPQWAQFKPLIDSGRVGKLSAIASNYQVDNIVVGKDTFSKSVSVPPIPDVMTFWHGARIFWLWVWLFGSVVFVLTWFIGSFSEMGHYEILGDINWKSVFPYVAIAGSAPASVPVLTVVGLIVGLVNLGEIERGVRERLPSVRDWCASAAYRLRLLRRLPPITVVPAQAGAASVIAAAPVVTTTVVEDMTGPLWYVVSERHLLGRKHLLSGAGFEAFVMQIHVPKSMRGYAIAADQIRRFEETFGLPTDNATDAETDIQRTRYRKYGRTTGMIEMRGVADEKRDKLKSVLKAISADNGGVAICYSNLAMVRQPDLRDGRRHILEYGSVPSSPQRFIYGENSEILAQLLDGVIYLERRYHYDDSDHPEEKLACVLRDAFRTIQVDAPLVGDERDHEDLERNLGRYRENYTKLCMRRLELEAKDIERDITCRAEAIAEAGRTITTGVRERHALQKRLKALKEGDWTGEKARLVNEFDQLASAKCVTGIRALEDRVEVDTRTVHIRHGKAIYRIGRFTIVLHNDGAVRFRSRENTARTATNCIHPHITGNGNACLGNITEPLAKLMADREYGVAAALIFRYLESYNENSPYARIDYWQKVKEITT